MAGQTETSEKILSCHECGASIYKEHLDKGLAGFHGGKLLCVYCLKGKKGSPRPTEEKPAAAAPASSQGEADLPPISLVDELEAPDVPAQKTSHGSVAGAAVPPAAEESAGYTRPLNKTGTGATRCRTFHSKLSDEAVRHMDLQINEWCDKHPDVEIKFTSTTVGIWTGKHAEPNLIVSVFY